MNDMTVAKPQGLDLLRAPFPAHQISKLPKPTKAQTDEVRANFKAGVRCEICGAWHHPKVAHLDYVGHAALTDRLLDCDPMWNWEPVSMTEKGLPATDQNGGMWIRLTVCGVTRLGYGSADGKTGGDAVKELIGDALRNAAMRFGAALDLWHKGDLHLDDDDGNAAAKARPPADDANPELPPQMATDIAVQSLASAEGLDALLAIWRDLPRSVQAMPSVFAAKEARKGAIRAALTPKPDADLGGDASEIPY